MVQVLARPKTLYARNVTVTVIRLPTITIIKQFSKYEEA